jgi:hypothetical protein
MTYECTICNACSFELKENYDRHRFLCIFKHKSKKEKTKMIERIPMKLTETDIYSLVAQLVYKNETLEKRLSSVEDELAKIRRKQRISILSWLNSSFGYRPSVTFKEWIKNLQIHVVHIEMVLKTDLLQGMVLCLKDAIFHSKIVDLPFCAFHQKNKQLYIYQEIKHTEEVERKWTILLNEDMISIVSILSQLFLRHYLQWKTVFLENSNSNSSPFLSEEREEEERKERELLYLTKITGKDISNIDKCRKIIETLIMMIQRDFNEIEIV